VPNRHAFAAEPDKSAPQHGGYCSYAMSRDYIADVSRNSVKADAN
jgi:hypothetical protein